MDKIIKLERDIARSRERANMYEHVRDKKGLKDEYQN